MAAKQRKSSVTKSAPQSAAVAAAPEPLSAPPTEDVAGRFVGQWNRLVSTTNWEKGRIICQWREALELAGAAVTEFSDEAWAQLVGGVTSQHVGRLRRVFQRFGAVFDQYEGLYWSHFQAGLDWDDAEMWLEGAIQNHWSVSQMRGKRWETLGNVGDPPAEANALEPAEDVAAPTPGEAAAAAGRPATKPAAPRDFDDKRTTKSASTAPIDSETDDDSYDAADDLANQDSPAPKTQSRKALSVDVDDLPDDLADAFEQFKLAIIAQRRMGWTETTPTAVIECLDALKELALAPSDD